MTMSMEERVEGLVGVVHNLITRHMADVEYDPGAATAVLAMFSGALVSAGSAATYEAEDVLIAIARALSDTRSGEG